MSSEPLAAVSTTPARSFDRASLTVIVMLALAWLGLAIGSALTREAWSNEAWSAIPAVNWLSTGAPTTTVLESKGTWLQGVDRHTYWIMPVHWVAETGWFGIVGFDLFRQRALSIVCALLLLVSWFRVVRTLSGNVWAAWLTVALLGFQRNIITAAANGRMDMMCAALGSASLAAWVEFRTGRPVLALLLSNACAAAAIFTHPCGILFAASLMLFIGIDVATMPTLRSHLSRLALIPLPYLAFAAAWGAYIAQAPADFRSQFLGNTSGFAAEYLQRTRFIGLSAPWQAFLDEVNLRYLNPFGFTSIHSPADALAPLWLAVCVGCVVVALAVPTLRRQRAVWQLASAGALVFLMMTLLEGMKFEHYVIHALPFYAAVAAIALVWLASQRKRAPLAVAAILLAACGPQALDVVRGIRANSLHRDLGAVAAFLKKSMPPGEPLIAPAEFGYPLGFTPALHDDVRLGYNTGLQPRFIVTSGWYRRWFLAAQTQRPDVWLHIRRTLSQDYRQVAAQGEYRVYRRRLE